MSIPPCLEYEKASSSPLFVHVYRTLTPGQEGVWPSTTDKHKAVAAADALFKKFLSHDSPIQINIDQKMMDQTALRMKLIHLYGPHIFEEAVRTHARPLFHSACVSRLTACVAVCVCVLLLRLQVLDPIKTMKKDVLPRFLASELAENLFVNLAMCDPLPDKSTLNVRPRRIRCHVAAPRAHVP